jgi:hypothetical protein
MLEHLAGPFSFELQHMYHDRDFHAGCQSFRDDFLLAGAAKSVMM